MTNYKLSIDSNGRIKGKATITYNDDPQYGYSWPCVNGTPGGSAGTMNGVVMHTMVGDLPGCIKVFNDPNWSASAYFGIAQDGHIHQFGPIGQNWEAWAQMQGNPYWYSIEHADHGNPDNPLTEPQMFASAQVVECLSAFANFPLQEANDVNAKGYGVHYMGGQAWGGHTCPDVPPEHVRSQQRPKILELAKQIRNPVVPVKWAIKPYKTDGTLTLNQICEHYGNTAGNVLYRTFSTLPRQTQLVLYVDNEWFDAIIPAGIELMIRMKVS